MLEQLKQLHDDWGYTNSKDDSYEFWVRLGRIIDALEGKS